MPEGTVTWGYHTGLTWEHRTFNDTWQGTGRWENTGDAEELVLDADEYMYSEPVHTGTSVCTLSQNEYGQGGDNGLLKYRTAVTIEGLTSAQWVQYTEPFMSLGYVQVRAENAYGN